MQWQGNVYMSMTACSVVVLFVSCLPSTLSLSLSGHTAQSPDYSHYQCMCMPLCVLVCLYVCVCLCLCVCVFLTAESPSALTSRECASWLCGPCPAFVCKWEQEAGSAVLFQGPSVFTPLNLWASDLGSVHPAQVAHPPRSFWMPLLWSGGLAVLT